MNTITESLSLAVALVARFDPHLVDIVTLSLRVSREFPLGKGLKVEGLAEAFNLTNRQNNVTINGNFGSGAFPTSPSATFGQVTAVGEPRAFQFGFRIRF